MSELPNGWVEERLSDLCEFNPKHPADADRTAHVSFVPMPAVDDKTGTLSAELERRPLSDIWKGYTHFSEGDVIFAKITPCMENGKIAVAEGLANAMACGSTEFHVLRGTGCIEPRYLWRFLRQGVFRRDAEKSMTGAVGQRRVPKAYLEERRLPLPPLAEQKRIVARLDALGARSARARKELERIDALVARYKQAVLSKAFSGELTKDWREDGAQWPRPVRLDSVATSFSYGSSAKSAKTGEIPVLRMGNIQSGKLDWADLVFTDDEEEIAKYALRVGDVLFNRTNSPALVGKTAIFRGERKAIYAGYLIRIQAGPNLNPEYLNYALNCPEGRAFSWRVKSDGVSQSNISASKLKGFEFAVPPSPNSAKSFVGSRARSTRSTGWRGRRNGRWRWLGGWTRRCSPRPFAANSCPRTRTTSRQACFWNASGRNVPPHRSRNAGARRCRRTGKPGRNSEDPRSFTADHDRQGRLACGDDVARFHPSRRQSYIAKSVSEHDPAPICQRVCPRIHHRAVQRAKPRI